MKKVSRRTRLLTPPHPASTLLCRLFSAAGDGDDKQGGNPSFPPPPPNRNNHRRREDSVIIPGTRHEYGSLHEKPFVPSKPAAAWQAAHNVDVQRVTQKAIVYELTQQQSQTLESVVPWFLETMPAVSQTYLANSAEVLVG